eukprot:Clim_evm67s236 gene=Clim_evmTU67s236
MSIASLRVATRLSMRSTAQVHYRFMRNVTVTQSRWYSEAAVVEESAPPGTKREPSEKVTKLADEITALNLIEVADLNALLKDKLGLSDAPPMMMGGGMPMAAMPGAGAPAAAAEEVEEAKEEAPAKTDFKVTLEGFDAANKVKLIKEVKGLKEGMNLVQAKKFVEGTPAVVLEGVPKEEAEEIKKKLEAVGGKIKIE